MSNNCSDCFNNCADRQTTDRCVQYTGVDIPILGVCNGDSLYEIEVIILEKLQELATGDGIDLSSVTIGCTFLNTILNGQDKTLKNLIQMLITANCSLRAMIQILQDEIGTPLVISAPCLTLPANPTRDDIITATVTKLCSLNTVVTTIQSDYQLASTLCADVTACIGPGSTQEVIFKDIKTFCKESGVGSYNTTHTYLLSGNVINGFKILNIAN